MSNEREYTIKSSQNGFEVSSDGGPTHRGSIENRDGCQTVQFTDRPAERPAAGGRRLSDALASAGGTIELNGSGMKVLGTVTHDIPRPTGQLGNILSTVTDLAGRPVSDLEAVKKSPGQFKVSIMGTETTVEAAMRCGLLSIGGSGDWKESTAKQMAFIDPTDPSNPENRDRLPQKQPDLTPRTPATEMLTAGLKNVGHDAAAVFAQAVTDLDSAARTLSEALQINDPQEAKELLSATVVGGMEKAAVILEKHFGVADGREAIGLITSGPQSVASRLVYGLMIGDKASFAEVAHRMKSGDLY